MNNKSAASIVYKHIKMGKSVAELPVLQESLRVKQHYSNSHRHASDTRIQAKTNMLLDLIERNQLSIDLIGQFIDHDLYYLDKKEYKYSFIDKYWLTLFEVEDGFVTVTDFPGDSWFEDFPNENGALIVKRYELIAFHLELITRFQNESNPYKKRELSFSIYTLEKKYNFKYLTCHTSDVYYLFNDEIVEVINADYLTIQKYPLSQVLRGLNLPTIVEWFQIKSVLYPISLVLLLLFMYPFTRFEATPPTLNFALFRFEIGDRYDEESFYTLNNNRTMVEIDYPRGLELTNPAAYELIVRARDLSNNSRLYNKTLIIEDTTAPIVTTIQNRLTINFNELDSIDFMSIISVEDNHIIESKDVSIPLELLSPYEYWPLGTYDLLYTITDHSNNIAIKQVRINVIDNVKPSLVLNTTNLRFPIEEFKTITSLENLILSMTDNHDDNLLSLEIKTSYQADEVGQFIATYVVKDRSNNQHIQDLIYEVYDITPPDVLFVDHRNFQVIYDFNLMKKDLNDFLLLATDNYKIKEIRYPKLNEDSTLSQIFNFKIEVEDYGGNIVTRDFMFNVLDSTPPSIQLLQESASLQVTIPDPTLISIDQIRELFILSIDDNLGGYVEFDVEWPEYVFKGENEIVLVATDQSGNSSRVNVNLTLR